MFLVRCVADVLRTGHNYNAMSERELEPATPQQQGGTPPPRIAEVQSSTVGPRGEWGHRDSPWSPGRQLLLPAQAATSAALSRRSPTRDDAVIADLARLLHAGVDDAAQPEPSRTPTSTAFEPLFLDYEQALRATTVKSKTPR